MGASKRLALVSVLAMACAGTAPASSATVLASAEPRLRVGGPVLVSANSSGIPANQWAINPSISRHGHLVSFETGSDNLGWPRAVHGTVFRKSMQDGGMRLVTRDRRGRVAQGTPGDHDMSADGNRFAFESVNFWMAPGVAGTHAHVFVRDLREKYAELVSLAPDGQPANGESSWPDLSDNGDVVVYGSHADNLAANDRNGVLDVFASDLSTGSTVLVSARPDGRPGNGESLFPISSGDGSSIAFVSEATDLVAGAPPGRRLAYVRHLPSRTTRWVGREIPGGGSVVRIVISSDGRRAALIVDNGVWVINLVGAEQPRQIVADGWVESKAFSADGRLLAYRGRNQCRLVDLQTGQHVVLSRSRGTGEARQCQWVPVLSADGRFAAFAASKVQIDPTQKSADHGIFRVPLYRDQPAEGR